MKTILKKTFYVMVNMVLILSFVSCNDTTDIEEGTDAPSGEPYEVSLGFGLSLEPISEGLHPKVRSIEHNYATTGYKVDIKGNLVNGDMVLEDVDLSQPIILEVTGSVEVTVKHPDFKKKKLGTVAYYGLDKVDVETYEGSGTVSVPLELVQGFVAVKTFGFVEGLIEKAKVGKDEIELNTYYYTDEVRKEMEVVVEFEDFFDKLEGEHDNVIGEGVVYEVTFSDAIGGNSQSAKSMTFEDFYLNKERKYIKMY